MPTFLPQRPPKHLSSSSDFKSLALKRVLAIALIFWVICCILSLHRYYNFFPTYVSFDQGIFNQVFWNNLHGRWFEGSLSSTEAAAVMQGNPPEVFYRRLGQHFTPALLLWLPWYALFPSPAGLVVLQITLVAIAGMVLYALARQYHPPRLSSWIAASYYAANAVISPTVANFHDISQIPLYVFSLFLAFEKRWWAAFAILTVLILAVREDTGIVLFSIGAYWIVAGLLAKPLAGARSTHQDPADPPAQHSTSPIPQNRRKQSLVVGIILCFVSTTYVVTVTNVIMPIFSDDISQRFMIEQFGQFVNNQQASTLDVLQAILSRPDRFLWELLTPPDRTVNYLLGQWVPLAFIPLISWDAWLLVAFPLLNTLIRKDPTALSLHLRYAMVWVPGLFYGAILWWAKHPSAFRLRFRRFWALCLALSLLFTLTANPNRVLSWLIPDSFQPWVYVSPVRQWQHSQAVRSLLAQIPPTASVTATDQLVPHLSNRREVLRFPMLRLRNDQREITRVDYVIADLWYLQQYQVAFADDRRTLQAYAKRIDRFPGDRYGLIAFQDGVVLLKRRAEPNSVAIEQWQAFRQNLLKIEPN